MSRKQPPGSLARELWNYAVPTFTPSLSSWKRWSLWAASSSTSWAVHPAPAVSVQAFLESVPMGGSSFQKNAACPHTAMRVLGGLTFLSTCLQLESDTAFACPALVASGDASAGNHEKKNATLALDLALAKFISDSSGTPVFALFSLLALLLFTSRVRFIRVQRPRFLFQCKRRKLGQVAPPLEWGQSCIFPFVHGETQALLAALRSSRGLLSCPSALEVCPATFARAPQDWPPRQGRQVPKALAMPLPLLLRSWACLTQNVCRSAPLLTSLRTKLSAAVCLRCFWCQALGSI